MNEPILSQQEKESRKWGALCHLAAFTGYFSLIGFIVGPLIVWLIKKDELPFVDDQGKEAVNFQISMAIYFLLSVPLAFLLIGIPLLIGLKILEMVLVIVAAVQASQGVYYRYPLSIRFIQ